MSIHDRQAESPKSPTSSLSPSRKSSWPAFSASPPTQTDDPTSAPRLRRLALIPHNALPSWEEASEVIRTRIGQAPLPPPPPTLADRLNRKRSPSPSSPRRNSSISSEKKRKHSAAFLVSEERRSNIGARADTPHLSEVDPMETPKKQAMGVEATEEMDFVWCEEKGASN